MIKPNLAPVDDASFFALTDIDRSKAGWLLPSRLVPSGYPGNATRKYLLKDDPETVVKIERATACRPNPDDPALQAEAAQNCRNLYAAVAELATFGVVVPHWEIKLVRQFTIDDRLIAKEDENSPFGWRKPYLKSEERKKGLDSYVRMERVEGEPISEVWGQSPEVTRAIDLNYSNLFRYVSAALQRDWKQPGLLIDIYVPEQYMYGVTAKDREPRVRLTDIAYHSRPNDEAIPLMPLLYPYQDLARLAIAHPDVQLPETEMAASKMLDELESDHPGDVNWFINMVSQPDFLETDVDEWIDAYVIE